MFFSGKKNKIKYYSCIRNYPHKPMRPERIIQECRNTVQYLEYMVKLKLLNKIFPYHWEHFDLRGERKTKHL